MTDQIFIKKTRINVPVELLFAWHAKNGAILRLTPPWAPLKFVSRTGKGIDKGVQVCFEIRLFKIPMVWEARHIDYKENVFFRDCQTRGPFDKWIHTHLFKALDKKSSIMEDRVAFRLPLGFLSFPFHGYVKNQLKRVFDYRHRILKHDLENQVGRVKMQRILISGASGTIGSVLVPFLRTCGHEVIRLVRDRSNLADDELYWDPVNKILDIEKAGPIDVVINLNGVDISRGRWTEKQKRMIIDSRIEPTRLLAEKIRAMSNPPSVFISSSAIGLYGEGKERMLTENATKGELFISCVCDKWEKASLVARKAGVRTVQLRIGVVLTPAGGALARMILPFFLGFGTRLSHGKQYMSWISMEDVLGGILHILKNQNIDGPVNLTAPHPVTNNEFARALGRVFSRPAFFRIPRWVANLLWGRMGRETLLTSARVIPEKLIDNGFIFQHKKLFPALKDMLGR